MVWGVWISISFSKIPDRVGMMTDEELKKQLEMINWPIDYGSVKVQIRHGKPSLVTIERTVKLD